MFHLQFAFSQLKFHRYVDFQVALLYFLGKAPRFLIPFLKTPSFPCLLNNLREKSHFCVFACGRRSECQS